MKIFTCDEAHTALADMLVASLGMSEGRSLEAHLAGCAPCTGQAKALLWQDRVLAELSAVARLDRMEARIHAALQNVTLKPVTEQVPAVLTVPPPRRSWGWFAAAAAFIMAVGGTVLFWPGDAGQPVTQRPPKENRLKAAPPTEEQIPETAVVSPEKKETPPPAPPDLAPTRPEIVRPGPAKPAPASAPEPALDLGLQDDRARATSSTPKPEARSNPIAPEVAPRKPIDFTPRNVDQATVMGLTFLKTKSVKLESHRGGTRDPHPEELVLWTFFMGGLPESDPELQRLFKGIMERKLERTYDVALQAMFLEELDRVRYQWRLAQCAQFLLDNQCKNGQWSYGDPTIFAEEIPSGLAPVKDLSAAAAAKKGVKEFPPPGERVKPKVTRFVPVQKKREGPESGDNSNSMYAALGLRACYDAGILLPSPAIELAMRAWRDGQIKPEPPKKEPGPVEGWGYGMRGRRSYGSMTAGAIGSLVIYDYILKRDWTKDREVRSGLDWLARNFSVTENPGPCEHGDGRTAWMYYYLYALERAGILYGAEIIGTRKWYEEGAQELLGAQRLDGAWMSKDGGNELWDTCFAILFLRRATRALPSVETPGPIKKH